MKTARTMITTAGLALTLSAGAFAQNAPYTQSHNLQLTANQAQLITAARLHPEVEVSRELHEQPVWPWMAKVVIGGATVQTQNTNTFFGGTQRQFTTGGTILHTWIDPLQKIDGNNGLDSDHSLVRAQRLHLQLMGVTTTDLAVIKNSSVASQPRGAIANHAQLIIPPQHESNETGEAQVYNLNFAQPTSGPSRMYVPKQDKAAKPQQNIPSVPRQTDAPEKSVASAE
ncbi:MAG: hypothetical protein GC162_12550 [Planctomycetes bacterium]|nr:hypothetical protein [Planctomycetota bacterium]